MLCQHNANIILGGYTVKVNTVHVANSECHWNFLVTVTKMYSDVHHKPQYNYTYYFCCVFQTMEFNSLQIDQ